jgi:hypothetical protein
MQKNEQRQVQMQVSPLRRQKAPPSVEMTKYRGGKSARFSRDDKV